MRASVSVRSDDQKMRPLEVRFGRHRDLLGTAVHAYVDGSDWWLRRARRVELDGGPEIWVGVAECAGSAARIECRTAPPDMGAEWFRATAPVALQMPKPELPLRVDMIATREERGFDVAYPFVLRQRGIEVLCGFSALGPQKPVRCGIATAVACRLLRVGAGQEATGD